MARKVRHCISLKGENMRISALNESGQPIDWWFIYKVPNLTKDAQTDSATGYEYVYFDSNSNQALKSPYRLDQGKGALNLTLDSVFKKPDATTGWILYNDEKPAGAPGSDDGNLGHTKGAIAFDTGSKTAFWLLHSWPKYAAPGTVGMPTPMYGQTFLCISLAIDMANKIAAQMSTHQEPQCYLPRAASLGKADPLFALTRPLPANPPPSADVLDCKSKAGMPFKVLAKNRQWNQDFWNGFVGPELGADMDVETWIRGPIPPVADTDGIHKTFDIKFVNLGPLGAHWAWPETHDHAKWGITKDSNWICVGDINRMISQRKRGGGTIAFQNQKLWQALSKTDLILAPPGHTRDEALALIKSTHAASNA
jgi:deoxyribonuclease-2